MMLKLRSKKFKDDGRKTSKTHEKYLPPLATKIMDPNTIHTYMEYFQKLSKAMHMEYVNITLDIGAGMNAYKLSWRNLEQFSNVVIHIDDFHYLKENFKVILLLNDDLLSSTGETSLHSATIFLKNVTPISHLLTFTYFYDLPLPPTY